MFRTLALLALFTSLAACGFHLRGSGPGVAGIEGARIQLDQVRAPQVGAELRTQLGLAGAKMVAGGGEAEYVVSVAGERLDREVLSVSPQTGKVEEYQLSLRVLLSIRTGTGEMLVEDQSISLSRDFTFDQDQALGKFSEEELLRQELAREAADQVLRRLSAQIERRQRGA